MSSADITTDNSAGALEKDVFIVVLGASGDLAKKKTFPALWQLFLHKRLPHNLRIVGYARSDLNKNEGGFIAKFTEYIDSEKKPIESSQRDQFEDFKRRCSYVSGPYDKDEGFERLEEELKKLEKEEGLDKEGTERHRLFYMALPPSVFIPVAKGLRKHNYSENGVNRIIVEKPFGMDLESSRDMMGKLKSLWREDETFRIDHYLGKEMVKNLLILRFGNLLLDSTFNNRLIHNIQITFKEPFGVEGRAGYFNDFGIIRDVMQNHLIQVLSLLTMERPVSFSSEDIRDEKVKVLRYITPIDPSKKEEFLIGQYTADKENDKPGYLDDPDIQKNDPESTCPTFAAVVLKVNSPRWEGVPFIMRAGKALDEQKVEIRIQYRDVTQGIFNDIARNELVIRLQPGEAVYLKMNAKSPGLAMKAVATEMDLTYKRRFTQLSIPEAYESLILDATNGDHSNFVRDDELDIAWKIFTPWLKAIEEGKIKPEPYKYGTRGPEALNDFVKRFGYKRFEYDWPKTSAAGN